MFKGIVEHRDNGYRHTFWFKIYVYMYVKSGIIYEEIYKIDSDVLQNTGYTQKNGAVSKVNKKFISHLSRAQRTPSAAATVQVSRALPAVRFSCLLRG